MTTDPLATSGLVIVDKPAGMTSHDVVSKLRKIFGTRKVGHAGTLDPMATGVLVAGIERGTKYLAHMVADTKSYDATIRLGAATTTDDMEGEITTRADAADISDISDEKIKKTIAAFEGEIMQRPSAVSAIKIDGKRAYQRVREGEQVELPARPVTIFSYIVRDIRRNPTTHTIDVDVSVNCSSGTYIRALARDLGEVLGVGGHLTALRRTSVGPFTLADSATIEELTASPRLSLSLDEALQRTYPLFAVTEQEAKNLAMGKWLEPRGLKGIHVAVDPDGNSIALVSENKKRLSTLFVARPATL